MKNIHKHPADPWGREVWLTQDYQTLKKLGDRFDLDIDTATSDGLCWGTAGPVIVIWVRPGAPVDVLVHECTHATLDILDWVEIDPLSARGEPMCYTLQRMVAAFIPHLLPPQNP